MRATLALQNKEETSTRNMEKQSTAKQLTSLRRNKPRPELQGRAQQHQGSVAGARHLCSSLCFCWVASSIQHWLSSALSFYFSIQLWVALGPTLSSFIPSIIWWLSLSLLTQVHQRENLSSPVHGLVYFEARIHYRSQQPGPGTWG